MSKKPEEKLIECALNFANTVRRWCPARQGSVPCASASVKMIALPAAPPMRRTSSGIIDASLSVFQLAERK